MPAGRDRDTYDRLRRRVLWSMPSGLYVVGTRAGERRNLMTISWATQVAMEPKLVGIGVEAASVTHPTGSAATEKLVRFRNTPETVRRATAGSYTTPFPRRNTKSP